MSRTPSHPRYRLAPRGHWLPIGIGLLLAGLVAADWLTGTGPAGFSWSAHWPVLLGLGLILGLMLHLGTTYIELRPDELVVSGLWPTVIRYDAIQEARIPAPAEPVEYNQLISTGARFWGTGWRRSSRADLILLQVDGRAVAIAFHDPMPAFQDLQQRLNQGRVASAAPTDQ